MMKTLSALIFSTVLLTACGGGGGSAGSCVGSSAVCSGAASAGATAPGSVAPAVLPAAVGNAIFAASASVAGVCAAPRPAGSIDAFTGAAYNDVQGSIGDELVWIRSFVNETYLWFDEVPAIDLAQYFVGATVTQYAAADNRPASRTLATTADVSDAFFASQRTPLTTASGKPKDQFHFTYPTPEWSALSQAGSSIGYGFDAVLLSARVPRKVLVAFTTPGSTAAANGLVRGTEFVSAEGVDIVSGAATATINEALFSPVAGKTYTFGVLDPGSTVVRSISMTAASVISTPVQNVAVLPVAGASVGYILFNDHIATAEAQLIAAVNTLNAANGGAGVSDLVLDLRYNGGGYADIAAELAYMIAGGNATSGKVFEAFTVNRKQPFGAKRPAAIGFHAQAVGFSTASGTPLPQLALPRVFVLTGANTCSASESIINGLRGAGVTVIQIGGTTCGKPYGFFPEENCNTTYFAVQFKGVNDVGFGDYADGFVPGGSATAGNNLPGCAVADDFTRALGDPLEGRLAAALAYRADGVCPATVSKRAQAAPEPVLVRSALRENAWLRHR